MKEIIKKKMNDHVNEILAKEKISNDDYCLLNMLYQKIENEEKLAEMEARNEEEREKSKQRQKEMYESLMKSFSDIV